MGLAFLSLLLLTFHRNSGDVGAAADLADAREAIDSRAGEGDPFAPIERGTFIESRRLELEELGVTNPGPITGVVLGSFATSQEPALAMLTVGSPSSLRPEAVFELTLRAGENGVVIVWHSETPTAAEVKDLRSGSIFDEPAVELTEDRVIVALPEVFDLESPWDASLEIRPAE